MMMMIWCFTSLSKYRDDAWEGDNERPWLPNETSYSHELSSTSSGTSWSEIASVDYTATRHFQRNQEKQESSQYKDWQEINTVCVLYIIIRVKNTA